MPPKAEYWVLTKEQFIEIKNKINDLGEKLLNNLQAEGFTKIKSSNDWLGLTVENKQNDLLTFVCFSVERESPMKFSLVLRKWDIKNPSETAVELYEKSFNTIDEFESLFNYEIKAIKRLLRDRR